ncbi:MAG TPA: hypothetical protein ENK05_08545 [Gammaproteobacteria bacterium]|nr:hypothetical protein [Gammaproteobacteria bacterium]
MNERRFAVRLLRGLATTLLLFAGTQAASRCLDCHQDMREGFAPGHAALAGDCSACHAGDATAKTRQAAHLGLIAFPGNLDNAKHSCGRCHARQLARVTQSLMHSGAGMVHTTRRVFGEPPSRPGSDSLESLGDSPADELLRKLCAGCHLGQEKKRHALDVSRDRGGGCLACHLNEQAGGGHPALGTNIGDGRCFGCHSRSGRISLSYAGLAEVSPGDGTGQANEPARLEDGRSVQAMPADTHHQAGLSCIDCHTERGLMGSDRPAQQKHEAVDIACEDCHLGRRRLRLDQWPQAWKAMKQRIPFPAGQDSEFLLTRNGTPLWNVELRDGRAWLYRKNGGGRVEIPPYEEGAHPLAREHARLSCAACHSQWAPRCYGCHLEYDPEERQYDHVLHRRTAGRWKERRSAVDNGLPSLGVSDDDRVVPVVPGMIMTLAHPALDGPRLVRRFAALSPHTIGKARDCASCHRSAVALGLGEGTLENGEAGWRFLPARKTLSDGLPADAWTDLEGRLPELPPFGVRPFRPRELRKLLQAPLAAGTDE